MAFVSTFEELTDQLNEMECTSPQMKWIGNGIPRDYTRKGRCTLSVYY